MDDKRDWMKGETFKLEVGESCVIKPSYLESVKDAERYKVVYTRTAIHTYVWLDNFGVQGTVESFSGVEGSGGLVGMFHVTDFSFEHWEKMT